MSIATCPPPGDLERLFLGGLPETQVDALEEHVLQCRPCLETLKSLFRAKETLSGVLSGDTGHDTFTSSPAVEDLIKRLSSFPSALSNRLLRGPAMLTFSCSTCQKSLSVQEDLAGKQIKCPACGQVQLAAVPVKVGLVPEDEPRTLASGDDHAPPTPSLGIDATQGVVPPVEVPDRNLTEFLSPSQAGDEIGRLGKYRILKILGHGGMGVVYKAEDPKLKRSVAIKAMLPALAASASAGKRFLREAEAMAAIEHDHVVRIYQVDEDRGVPFLAMEFLKGEPLDERLKRDAMLPLAEVLRIGREIAEALGAAHATGLIHRDVKPGNIWLEAPRNRVKILDFGLARAASQDASLTQQGAIVGTPAFMAPEQARGEIVDPRCDLFSLGVVLYRLCCGRQPFVGNDSMSTLVSIAMDQPKAPILVNAELPQELSDLVMKLLEKDPAKRCASAAEVIAVLQKLEKKLARQQEAADKTVTLPALTPRVAAPRRRLPMLVAAAVLLAGLVGLGMWAAGLIRFQTDDGDFVVQTDDPSFSFQVAKGGGVTLKDSKTGREYRMTVVRHDKATGEYELEITDVAAELSFKTKKFTIKRGTEVALAAWFERKKEATGQVDDAWIKEVAALPAEKQVQAVAAKLKERNPGFNGRVTQKIEDGVVTSLVVLTDNITDISPVRALTGLKALYCSGTWSAQGWMVPFADLSPLRGMKLVTLNCLNTNVASLSPLRDMHLTELACGFTDVSDLSPLKGMPLTKLQCYNTNVSDLTPLMGMPLTILDCNCTKVSDLTPLKDMKSLTKLWCRQTPVSDLSPLKEMKLTTFKCQDTNVSNLSLLKGMPLQTLTCDFKPERDAETVRSIKTLENINDKPAAEFWKEVDAQLAVFDVWLKRVAAMPAEKQVQAVADKLKERNPGFDGTVTHKIEGGVVTDLKFFTDNVTDISPVRALVGLRKLSVGGSNKWFEEGNGRLTDLSPLMGMKLVELFCSGTRVSDLSPLKEMKLTSLRFYRTPVTDLSPLKDMKLTVLWFNETKVTDLSPLKDMKLTDLRFDGTKVSDLSPLKDMKLTELGCSWTHVSDLSLLKDMRLTFLNCSSTKVADLSPLKGMPLTVLYCDFNRERDAELLRSIKTLEKINEKPAAEFWKEVDAQLAVFDAWLKRVAAMPAEKQVQAVAAKLQERNPGFDGKIWRHTIDKAGVVTELGFETDNVTDISPVRALTGLRTFRCNGSVWWGKAKLADLSPLKGMKLTTLYFYGTKVSDLTPLKDMKLTELSCSGTPVSDLSPLKDMKLTQLHCIQTKVSDLSPLRGMPLQDLQCDFKAERDAEILRAIKTLVTINEKPAAEFWKEVDAESAAFDAWVKQVAAMPAEKQVEEVAAKLKERNLGFDGTVTHKIEGGVVTQLQFFTDNVTDIAPVRALTGLRTFSCGDSAWRGKGKLADLAPLKDLKLVYLDCHGTPVSDLAPLKDMKLTFLDCSLTKVSDLAPLKDMKLTVLYCGVTKVSDLAPLKDMKLTSLSCGGTKVSNLAPLKDMKLTDLTCSTTNVSDLAPLKGMPLTYLNFSETKVSDLAPLKGMPLKTLYCDFKRESDAEILRSIKTLETINKKPAAAFWQEVDAQQAAFDAWVKQVATLPADKQVQSVADKLQERNPEFDGKVRHKIEGGVVTELAFDSAHVADITPLRALPGLTALRCGGNHVGREYLLADLSPLKDMKLTSLAIHFTHVSDLSPLKNVKLTVLDCSYTQVADLSPLQGMQLTTLSCNGTKVSDLSPLKDMKLTDLDCSNTKVADLSPLRGLPLKHLYCDFKAERDAEILRSIKTLEKINGKPLAEFWKD